MTTTLAPHVNFDGDARAALDAWAAALGGTVTAATYGQVGASDDPAWADRIVFGQVEAPGGAVVMAFDVWPGQAWDRGVDASYLYLRGSTEEEVTSAFTALAEGGQVRVPLGPSAWSPLSGQVLDRFGVVWQLEVVAAG